MIVTFDSRNDIFVFPISHFIIGEDTFNKGHKINYILNLLFIYKYIKAFTQFDVLQETLEKAMAIFQKAGTSKVGNFDSYHH